MVTKYIWNSWFKEFQKFTKVKIVEFPERLSHGSFVIAMFMLL